MKAAKLGNEEVTHCDRISHLPDDLLLLILPLVPLRIAMSASLLSKRWSFVWKMMPTLVYDETSSYNGPLGFDKFCCLSLPLHEAPVLKTLNVRLINYYKSIDTLLFPNIRSPLLEITIIHESYFGCENPIRFPNNLKVFKTLLVMKLQGHVLLDVVDDSPVCFPSLKSLHLTCLRFERKESFKRILSACPVLEDLFLHKLCEVGHYLLTISSLSLQRLSIDTKHTSDVENQLKLEIRAPSLISLKIYDLQGHYNFVEDMPKLVEADVSVNPLKMDNLRKVLSSLERLSIGLYPSMVRHLMDSLIIFNWLLHLELDIIFGSCSDIFLRLLKYFPNLQSLKLANTYLSAMKDPRCCLVSEPSCVPKCLSFHLEILQWKGYGGTLCEREAAVYVLKNAHRLKTATISLSTRNKDRCQIMMKDLRAMSKASASCQLVIQ